VPSTGAADRSLPWHSARVADQLTLEWGVYPTTMSVAESVDALMVARDYAGLSSGARVVLTAGRRAGTPGATNLIMVREIP
jgi:pyruvate kinase